MEQNLSEKERKQRLALGILSGILAALAFWRGSQVLALVLGLGSIGFIANYFTCFCGTKKALNSIKERIR